MWLSILIFDINFVSLSLASFSSGILQPCYLCFWLKFFGYLETALKKFVHAHVFKWIAIGSFVVLILLFVDIIFVVSLGGSSCFLLLADLVLLFDFCKLSAPFEDVFEVPFLELFRGL